MLSGLTFLMGCSFTFNKLDKPSNLCYTVYANNSSTMHNIGGHSMNDTIQTIPPALQADLDRLRGLTPWSNPRYTLSDVGNGYLLADFYRDTLRYANDRGCWYVYDGRRWEADRSAFAAMSLCKRLTHLLGLLPPLIEDDDLRERFVRHVQRWRTRRTREVALRDAAEVYPVKAADFDKDPMVLNCLNGTLRLDTRVFYEHNPADFISKLANVHYNPAIESQDWEDFATQVTETNHAYHKDEIERDPLDPHMPDACIRSKAIEASAHKRRYLQKTLGYCLTGLTNQECMFVLHGESTRNGKSTLVETFATMMGDYAATAMPETLAAQAFPSGRGPSEDIARLCGARFVAMSEPDRNVRLSPSLLKLLTGNDTITCRFLHENSFEYRPQFKLFMNTNHLPDCGDDTVFTSGRMRVIRFERHFKPRERDLTLKTRLCSRENLCGLLNWALRGLERIGEEGFDPPECVTEAAESYRTDCDPVAQFVAECLVKDHKANVRTADVYRAYRPWCEANGYEAENVVQFKRALARHGKVGNARPKSGGNPTVMLDGFKMQR